MSYTLSVDQVQKFLPHRHPFLMVDRVMEIHPTGDLSNKTFDSSKVGIKVVARKSVAFNEPWFVGHFPGFAIMPGVLIVEALAQTASFSVYPYYADDIGSFARNFECVLLGVDQTRFRKPVVPGDALELRTEVTRVRGKLWGFRGEAFVDGQKAAETDILVSLISHSKLESAQ